MNKEKNEKQALTITDYAVTMHFVAESNNAATDRTDTSDAGDDSGGMEQFERDLLAYAWRYDPPLRTRIVRRLHQVEVAFPSALEYVDDAGEIVTLYCPDRQKRVVQVIASRTDFPRSSVSVLHVALGPKRGCQESHLSEWEIVKLSKLWEGGEGVPDPGSDREASEARSGKWISFYVQGNPSSMDPEEFVRYLFPKSWELLKYRADASTLPLVAGSSAALVNERQHGDSGKRRVEIPLRAGTVQIGRSEKETKQLQDNLAQLREDPLNFSNGHVNKDELIAWGGIVQGLLDFHNIKDDELSDAFDPIAESQADLTGFHKGSLISIGINQLGFITVDSKSPSPAGNERRASPIGVSPYLALPHAVVMHNEQRLRRARGASPQLLASERRLKRLKIKETSDCLIEQRRIISTYLQNIFHYPTEHQLYKEGHETRGLDYLYKETVDRNKSEQADLEERVKRRDVWLVLSGILLAVLFGVQQAIAEAQPLIPYPYTYIIPGAGLLVFFGVVIWAARRA